MSFDLKIQNGDIKIGSNGDLEQVENSEKLIQDILKIATTPARGNPFYPWYGSTISKTLIGSAYPQDFTISLATEQLSHALETFKNLQNAQDQSGQKVTAAEALAVIQSVSITQGADPRAYFVTIRGYNKAFNSIKTGFGVG